MARRSVHVRSHPGRRSVGALASALLSAASLTSGGGPTTAAVRTPATTIRVSVATHERQVSRSSESPALSGNARFVAFTSDDPGLLPAGAPRVANVFIRDRTLA